MKKITQEWITKAEMDYLVTIRESKADPPATDAVCFHAQQCIEKYLKAVLQENEIEFEKIHDLEVLREQCKDFVPELKGYGDDLIRLSTYAVDVRYPGFDVFEEDAEECVRIMEKVREKLQDKNWGIRMVSYQLLKQIPDGLLRVVIPHLSEALESHENQRATRNERYLAENL